MHQRFVFAAILREIDNGLACPKIVQRTLPIFRFSHFAYVAECIANHLIFSTPTPAGRGEAHGSSGADIEFLPLMYEI
jgi:hypothetical protein